MREKSSLIIPTQLLKIRTKHFLEKFPETPGQSAITENAKKDFEEKNASLNWLMISKIKWKKWKGKETTIASSERTKRDGKLLKLTLGGEQVTGKIIQFILQKIVKFLHFSAIRRRGWIQSVRGDGDKNVY